jgi:hypothetical protein
VIRSYRFTDECDHELTVSELPACDGVELRVGCLPFTFSPEQWLEFAELVASSKNRYGDPRLLVDLGRSCGHCAESGDVDCPACKGWGFLPGEPDPEPTKRAP